LRRRNTEALRSHIHQRRTSLNGSRAQLWAAARNRRARIGAALIRRHVRIEPHRFHLAHVDIKLFGGHLRQRSRGALAEFGESYIDGGGVVGMDGEPRIDLPRIRRTGRNRALLSA